MILSAFQQPSVRYMKCFSLLCSSKSELEVKKLA